MTGRMKITWVTKCGIIRDALMTGGMKMIWVTECGTIRFDDWWNVDKVNSSDIPR
jgi:hypothetical protein